MCTQILGMRDQRFSINVETNNDNINISIPGQYKHIIISCKVWLGRPVSKLSIPNWNNNK